MTDTRTTTAQIAERAAEAIDCHIADVFVDGQIRSIPGGATFDVEDGGQIFKFTVTEYLPGTASEGQPYEIPQHNRRDGRWCRWSGCRTTRTDLLCPDRCQAPEPDPPDGFGGPGSDTRHREAASWEER